MSVRNGDKSRFGRLRKLKIKNRQRIRDFRKAYLVPKTIVVGTPPAV